MGYEECDIYNYYRGFWDKRRRQFSVREEQAIKWAIIHQTPTLEDIPALRRITSSPSKLRDNIHSLKESRYKVAFSILKAVFDKEEDAINIFKAVAKPHLDQAFHEFEIFLTR